MSSETAEGAIVALLAAEDRVCSIEEVAREIGDELAARDAVAALAGAGLVHLLDRRFVVASRAAIRAEQVRL